MAGTAVYHAGIANETMWEVNNSHPGMSDCTRRRIPRTALVTMRAKRRINSNVQGKKRGLQTVPTEYFSDPPFGSIATGSRLESGDAQDVNHDHLPSTRHCMLSQSYLCLTLLARQLVFSVLVLTILSSWPTSEAQADTPFEFKQDDVVAIFGNGLADRMQHDPWVETVLQSRLRGKNVRFRNMSFSGDVVNRRPRNKGFTNDTEYLQHVAPSVVWIMYGYNESHAGPDGAAAYENDLVKLVEKYRGLRKEAGR